MRAVCACCSRHIVKSVSPIYSQSSEHLHKNPYSHSCRTIHLERLKALEVCPRVSALKKSENIDRRHWIERYRIAGFESKFVKYRCSALGVQTIIVISPEGHQFPSVQRITCQSVSSEIVSLKRRIAYLAVILSQETKPCPC